MIDIFFDVEEITHHTGIDHSLMLGVLIESLYPFYLLKDTVVGEIYTFPSVLLRFVFEVLQPDAAVGKEIE